MREENQDFFCQQSLCDYVHQLTMSHENLLMTVSWHILSGIRRNFAVSVRKWVERTFPFAFVPQYLEVKPTNGRLRIASVQQGVKLYQPMGETHY